MFINDVVNIEDMDDRICHKIECQFCHMILDDRDKDFDYKLEAHNIYHETHIMADGNPRNSQGEKPVYKPYYG